MKRFLCLTILVIFLVFMYAKYIEPNYIGVNEFLIKDKNVPSSFDGIKIAHFSDILYKSENELNLLKKTIKEIENANADIIIFTGDLINKKINDEEKETLINILNTIKPKLYKYAVLGDHDSDKVKEILEESNFILLENTSEYLFYNSSEPILIAGGDNLTNDNKLQDENITYNYSIALTHKPDNFDNLDEHYNIVLAGHNLGGEIRVPFIGAIVKKSGAQKYTDITYNHKNSSLYISNGIGIEKSGLRFLNQPSINIYRLYSK